MSSAILCPLYQVFCKPRCEDGGLSYALYFFRDRCRAVRLFCGATRFDALHAPIGRALARLRALFFVFFNRYDKEAGWDGYRNDWKGKQR